jgi:hypothetical protein
MPTAEHDESSTAKMSTTEPTARTRKSKRITGRMQWLVVGGFILIVIICVAVAGGIAALLLIRDSRPVQSTTDDAPADGREGRILTGEEVYKRLLKSTAVVLITEGANAHRPIGLGSGVLVHGERRLLLTNYHVVKESSDALVFFPRYELNGEVIVRPNHYTDNAEKYGQRAKVVFRDSRKDLALLELTSLPQEIVAIPLAVRHAVIGSKLYSVGASGVEGPNFSGTFWRLSSGETRGRNEHKLLSLDAMFLESQKPINPGDSGGPTVNEAGALTGLVCLSDRSREAVSLDIDLVEIERFLKRYAQDTGWVWSEPRLDLGRPTPSPPGPITKEPVLREPAPVPSGPEPMPAKPEPMPVKPEMVVDPVPKLVADLSDVNPEVRCSSLLNLAELGARARRTIPQVIKAADDTDIRVQRAAEETLEKIGPPGKVEMLAYEEALLGTNPNAQRIAAEHYLRQEKPTLPDKTLPALVRMLESPSPASHLAALRLLATFGTGGKTAALKAVLKLAASDSEAGRLAAFSTIEKWAPYSSGDTPQWIAATESSSTRLRALAVSTLAGLATNGAEADRWFRPRLKDTNTEVVLAALKGLSRWGVAAREASSAVEGLTASKCEAVALAALQTLHKILTSEQMPAALDRLRFDDPKSEAIIAALQKSTLAAQYPDAAAAIKAYKPLLKDTSKVIRVETLRKLMELGPKAESALPEIVVCLRETDLAILNSALETLAAVGESAAAQADSVLGLLRTKPNEVTGGLAFKAILAMGPAAVIPLGKAYRLCSDKKQADQILVRLEGYRDKAASALSDLLAASEDSKHPHGSFHHANLAKLESGKDATDDPLARSLAKIGGDGLAKKLIELTASEVKNVLGKDIKFFVGKFGGKPRWALQLFLEMDPASVTAEQRLVVYSHLKSLEDYDLSRVCRKEAQIALKRWEVNR